MNGGEADKARGEAPNQKPAITLLGNRMAAKWPLDRTVVENGSQGYQNQRLDKPVTREYNTFSESNKVVANA